MKARFLPLLTACSAASIVSCVWDVPPTGGDILVTASVSTTILALGRVDTVTVILTNETARIQDFAPFDCADGSPFVVATPAGVRVLSPIPPGVCFELAATVGGGRIHLAPGQQVVFAILTYNGGGTPDSSGKGRLLPPGAYVLGVAVPGLPQSNLVPLTIAPPLPIDSLRATLGVSPASFRIGDTATVAVVVTNIGSQTASVAAHLCPQAFVVTTPAGAVVGPDFSSLCTPGDTTDRVAIAGGAQMQFSFAWSGSATPAAGVPTTLAPGDYLLRAVLRGSATPLSSEAVAIRLLP